MSCTDTFCGTGGWSGPKPGDPDNNSILSATPAYGGVDIRVSLPVTNPFAVAHIVLYRGTSNNFDFAVKHATFSGDFFYDRIAKADIREYFYWIILVSINGTYGAPIGPASATPMGLIAEVIEDLTGQIDRGVLAQSLKTEIDRITDINGGLSQEIIDRLAQNAANAAALADLDANVGQALTLIAGEVTIREAADEALIDSINLMYASLGDGSAAILEETTLRVAADAALASQITTAESTLNGDIAAAQTTLQTAIDAVDGTVNAMWTAKVQVNGLIGGFGLSNDGDTVEAGFDVDRFWIGRTSADKRKPFIIDNGVVYIDDAAINKLTFSKLRDESGSFVVQNGKVKADYIDTVNINIKGQVNVGSYTGYTWPTVGNGAHLSRNGLLIGSPHTGNGKYFQIFADPDNNQGGAFLSTNMPAYIPNLFIDTDKMANSAITSGTAVSTGGSSSTCYLSLNRAALCTIIITANITTQQGPPGAGYFNFYIDGGLQISAYGASTWVGWLAAGVHTLQSIITDSNPIRNSISAFGFYK